MEEIRVAAEAVGWSTTYLACRQIQGARLDAEVLICHALGLDREKLYANYKQPLKLEDEARYLELIRRRGEHEPVAYLTGAREFWSLPLQVTPQVLIPRPETETLVELTLSLWEREQNPEAVIIEVGTGAGNIVLALARELPGVTLFASDISPAAIEVAFQNAKQHGLSDKIQFLVGDLFTPYRELGLEGKVDIVVSNPPYIPTEAWDDLPPDIRDYEPHLALDGGAEGLEVIGRLIEEAACFLRPGGYLVLEIGADQAEKVKAQFQAQAGWDKPRIYPDAGGLPRVAVGRKTIQS